MDPAESNYREGSSLIHSHNSGLRHTNKRRTLRKERTILFWFSWPVQWMTYWLIKKFLCTLHVPNIHKPAFVQDTEYMVEKTYHIAPYLGAFGAYMMPEWPIYGSKGVSIYQNDRWNVAVNTCNLPSGQKAISFVLLLAYLMP